MSKEKIFQTFSEEMLPLIVRENCLMTCKHGDCEFSCSFGNIGLLEKHLQECMFLPIQCQICNIETRRKDMTNHMNECINKEVSCSFDCYGCETKVPRKELFEHVKTCQWQPYCKRCGAKFQYDKTNHHCQMDTTRCRFCNEELLKKDLQDHYEFCYYKHEAYLNNYFESERGECLCRYCAQKFSRSRIGFHIENCKYRTVQCNDCGKHFFFFASLSHKEECPIAVCDKCGDKIEKSSTLKHYLTKCNANKNRFSCKTCERRIDENLITNEKEMEDNHRIHAFQMPFPASPTPSSPTTTPSPTETMPPKKFPPSVDDQQQNDPSYADLNSEHLRILSSSPPSRIEPLEMLLPESHLHCARSRRRFRHVIETVDKNDVEFRRAMECANKNKSRKLSS